MATEPPPHPAARSYDGDGITVEYDVHRPLHATECVHGPPAVPDTARRPCTEPGGAPADAVDAVADVVHRSPGGAPKRRRADGGSPHRDPGGRGARRN